jgi:hypothetical protein
VEIGKEDDAIIVEPLEDPFKVPERETVPEPERERVPVEPEREKVPA